MLANVLKSQRAIQMSIRIIDIFVQMRETLQTNKEVLLKVELLENRIKGQDKKMTKYEQELQTILECVREILAPPAKEREKIGYKIGK
jgi:phage regulator Rha-like protein